MSLHDFRVHTLAGAPHALDAYQGRVVLVVNTASECGYTPQYDGLEKLHEQYEARGLSVVGFPSNDFGAQEPGSPDEIAAFCTTRFGVKFPLMEKVVTRGPDASPVYRALADALIQLERADEVRPLLGASGPETPAAR